MTDGYEQRRDAARNGSAGKTMTDCQFVKTEMICAIVKREIERSGSFREPLTDYAHALERFKAVQAETMIRDVFKALNGQTMNQMREHILKRDENLPETAQADALAKAWSIEARIKDGDTMPFYRAFDDAAVELAQKYGITELRAKSLMKEVYREVEGRDLYEDGKQLEKDFHLPARDAARAERSAPAQTRGFAR